jgi:flagellar basal-body rod modification protein FlgD
MTGLDTLLPAASSAAASDAAVAKANDLGSADRFLKLMVAQLQNQDPLNPMDNAQITSQMAQINTVNGIERLNGTMQGLNGQMVQMQALQGAMLVGRDVTLQGDKLSSSTDGRAMGGFEIAAGADRVQVELIDERGAVVQQLELGAQPPGRHGFEWPITQRSGVEGWTFRVSASAGGQPIGVTPLMLDRVYAVRSEGGQLTLDTVRSGAVPYGQVRAIN